MSKTKTDPKKAAKIVFANTNFNTDSIIKQKFVSTITMLCAWQNATSQLSEIDRGVYLATAADRKTSNHAQRRDILNSALFHLGMAKKEYNSLVDSVLEADSIIAYRALENLKNLFENSINFLNASKYRSPTNPSASSGTDRRPLNNGKYRSPAPGRR